MSLLKITDQGVLLCCGKAKCPVVSLDGDKHVKITDDDGNTVKIEIEQAELLGDALDQLRQDT